MTELMNTNSAAPAEARTIETITAEINAIRDTLAKITLSSAIQIGERLTEAKALLKHGEWGAWLKESVNYSQDTAERLMKVYRDHAAEQKSLFGAEPKSATLRNLSLMQAVLLCDIPAEEREAFVIENDVENKSIRELKKLIRERDEARARAEDAEAAKNEAEMDALNARTEKAAMENELKAAKEAVHLLETRPIEVAVQEPDPEVIKKRVDDAVDLAMEEAKRAAKKTESLLKEKLADAEKAREKLEADAEKARKAAEEKGELLEALRAKLENAEDRKALEAEIGELKKALAMANPGVTAFKTLLAQWTGLFDRLVHTLEEMDEETAGRLRAALKAQTAKLMEGLTA